MRSGGLALSSGITCCRAGCATTPAPAPNSLPVEQIVNEPDEVAFPAEGDDAPEPPPEELEAAAPSVEPLAPAVAHGNVIARNVGSAATAPFIDLDPADGPGNDPATGPSGGAQQPVIAHAHAKAADGTAPPGATDRRTLVP